MMKFLQFCAEYEQHPQQYEGKGKHIIYVENFEGDRIHVSLLSTKFDP